MSDLVIRRSLASPIFAVQTTDVKKTSDFGRLGSVTRLREFGSICMLREVKVKVMQSCLLSYEYGKGVSPQGLFQMGLVSWYDHENHMKTATSLTKFAVIPFAHNFVLQSDGSLDQEFNLDLTGFQCDLFNVAKDDQPVLYFVSHYKKDRGSTVSGKTTPDVDYHLVNVTIQCKVEVTGRGGFDMVTFAQTT